MKFDIAKFNSEKDQELWTKRMERLSEMWDSGDFTTEEMNIMCVFRDRLATMFSCTPQHAYKILRRFEAYKEIHLSRMPPDMSVAHETRAKMHDRSFTEFGRKYVEHFGHNATDDRNRYWIEKRYYQRHGVVSWEDERCILDSNGRKHHLSDKAFYIYQQTGICRANDPDLFDAVLQHYTIYGDLEFKKDTKWLSKAKKE